jgi:tetratricopeptide (TPR) repeat protein
MWEKLLTDTDGPNVELQSGRLFNQASPGSELTPFKHVGFAPYTADAWTDLWFPVKQTRGLTNASPRGALNLRVENNWLKIDWMSLEKQTDTLTVQASGKAILSRKLVLRPMELYRDSVKWEGSIDQLVVRLGEDVLTDDPGKPLNRPIKAPENFDWESESGLLLQGSDLYKQKNYVEAEEYLMKALGKNPNLVPALTQMSQIRYRQGLYEKSREFARAALAVNTYDGEANYFWGLSSEQTGNSSDALDGYSVAALSPAFRQAAWLRIAYLAIKRKDWREAENVIGKCLDSYPRNENAWIVKAMIDRKRSNSVSALAIINSELTLDPLNHRARFEKYLNTGMESDRNVFVYMIRQELPHETFIEMAIQYHEWKLDDEALKLLELAPAHPMVQIWQAYLLNEAGEKKKALDKLDLAMAATPELVFPFRPEMTKLFTWANTLKPDWKWRYYEALIYWQYNQTELAKPLFVSCGTEPDFAPFYLAKAKLFKDDPSVVKECVEKAYLLEPLSWREGKEMAKLYIREAEKEKALQIAKKNYLNHPDNCMVGLQYANILSLNGSYAETLKALKNLVMLPAESDKWSGDIDAHSLFRETNIKCALNQIKDGKWNKALLYLKDAESWPENLGWGEPYFPDNRVTQFLTAYCYKKLGDSHKADESFNYIKIYSNPEENVRQPGESLSEIVNNGERDFRSITGKLVSGQSGDEDLDILKEFMTILR